MATKERLIELIYSCRNTTVGSVVDTILRETGSTSNEAITEAIRKYKDKGSGLEKCVDEVYELLCSKSDCARSSTYCEGKPCGSCDGSDPYGQTRFSNLEC